MAFGRHHLKSAFIERVPQVEAFAVERGAFPEITSLLRADQAFMKFHASSETGPEHWTFVFVLPSRGTPGNSNFRALKTVEVMEHDYLVWPPGKADPYAVEVWDRDKFMDTYVHVSEGSR